MKNKENTQNNLNELNSVLFDTIRAVQAGTMDVSQANAIQGLSNTVINGAKTLLQAHKQTQSKSAPQFFELPEPATPSVAALDSYKEKQKQKSSSSSSAADMLLEKVGATSIAAYRAQVGERVYTEELRKVKEEIANSRM